MIVEDNEKQALPVLEMLCQTCEGAGGWDDYDDRITCGTCCGAGYVPTELGESILQLLRHNLRSGVSVLLSSRQPLGKGKPPL